LAKAIAILQIRVFQQNFPIDVIFFNIHSEVADHEIVVQNVKACSRFRMFLFFQLLEFFYQLPGHYTAELIGVLWQLA
jgi:hypothetical protein